MQINPKPHPCWGLSDRSLSVALALLLASWFTASAAFYGQQVLAQSKHSGPRETQGHKRSAARLLCDCGLTTSRR